MFSDGAEIAGGNKKVGERSRTQNNREEREGETRIERKRKKCHENEH